MQKYNQCDGKNTLGAIFKETIFVLFVSIQIFFMLASYDLFHYLDPVEYSSCDEFLKNFENISEQDKVLTLHGLLSARMLRRTKNDVFKNMVGKTEQIISISLMPQQISLYKAILMKNYKQLNVVHGAANSSGRNALMDLRKICNHPYLFAKQDLEAKMLDDGVHYHVPSAMKANF